MRRNANGSFVCYKCCWIPDCKDPRRRIFHHHRWRRARYRPAFSGVRKCACALWQHASFGVRWKREKRCGRHSASRRTIRMRRTGNGFHFKRLKHLENCTDFLQSSALGCVPSPSWPELFKQIRTGCFLGTGTAGGRNLFLWNQVPLHRNLLNKGEKIQNPQ